jgi:hypothetical protein
VPDHTVIARFRRRHVDGLQAVFATVLRMCRDAGLIRRGLVVLDGTHQGEGQRLAGGEPQRGDDR